MIRVMIVDDHPVIRQVLARILGAEPDIEVVAVCVDGQDALERAAVGGVDVIVMDVTMPRLDGAQASARILGACPEIRIWLHTAAPHHPGVAAAIAAGAAGVIAKSGDPAALLEKIRSPRSC